MQRDDEEMEVPENNVGQELQADGEQIQKQKRGESAPGRRRKIMEVGMIMKMLLG